MPWTTQLRDVLSLDPDTLAPRVTVLLTLAVAILSIVTGVANISAQSVVGPLAEFIPPAIQRTAGFTGVLTGFMMITSALGLRRGLRVAWLSTIVLLPLTALQGLLQSSPLSAPLVILSVLALPSVLVNRSRFTNELSLSTSQLAALIAVLGVQVYGTVGTYALREEFAAVETLVDAFYYTLVTASTVGYGDATPTTQGARLFGMTVVVFGTASFALALGTLLGPLLEARFARALGRMTDRNYDLFQDHVLILGWGDLTEAIIEEIDPGQEFVLVTAGPEHVASLSARDIEVLSGNPSDEAPLEKAGIAHARTVLVATNDDGDDALAVLTARELNPDVRIVAAATNRENVHKLERAGADTVISPTALGARMLVDASFGEEDG
ncbi:MAG: NAD-binding protein [Halodesulfurarchaeum sp.]|nr:NAD-binding protein [Halodesulfurarchaeum sp.]